MSFTFHSARAESGPGRSAALPLLLELTSLAWADALAAIADHDAPAARRVLIGARERRRLAVVADVETRARLGDARIVLTCRHLVRSANAVELVGDLARLEQLLVAAARGVVEDGVHPHRDSHDDLQEDLRRDVEVLRRLGTRRLHDLACARSRRSSERDFLACGRELDEVAARLTRRCDALLRPDEATGLCAALAAGVLDASRHARCAA